MIEVRNLVKIYSSKKNKVIGVDHVSLTIKNGEIFGIVGYSGAGKSTLLRCLNLLERPTSGQVIIDGVDLTTLNKKELRQARLKIGMIFQHFQIETIIMAGGMVGGFGDRYERIAGAHSVHNGLTKIPETHHLLHGEKVAYGILVQLALEENWDEIHRLLPFYRDLKLPYTLKQLGLDATEKEKLMYIAEEIIKPHESIHLMNIPVDREKIVQAFYQLEKLAV